MEKTQKTLTASQRLEGLEQAMSMLDQQMANITTNLQTTINAVTLLSKKVEAMVRLGNSTQQINSVNIAAELININIQELEEKVQELKNRGMAVEASEVGENSFLVGRELGAETSDVENARIQFPIFGLNQEVKEKLLKKKVGDIIDMGAGRNRLELTEIYNIVLPNVSQKNSGQGSSASSDGSEPSASSESSAVSDSSTSSESSEGSGTDTGSNEG